MNTPLLDVITVSTRQGRKGPAVAAWFTQVARAHAGFAVEDIDLAAVDLPLMNEPEHPRLRRYTHEYTKAWSALVDRADAFVLVTPEYNHGAPPPLINALDYLVQEWAYKPVGFVSYGGVSGGLRAVQMTKPILTMLKMMPIPEAVVFSQFTNHLDPATGVFAPPESQTKAAGAMLDELRRWSTSLRSLRSR